MRAMITLFPLIPDEVLKNMDRVIAFFPTGKNKFCLLHTGFRYILQYWKKTRRRKSPYDKFYIGSVKNGKIRVARVSDNFQPMDSLAEDLLTEHKTEIQKLCQIDAVLSV